MKVTVFAKKRKTSDGKTFNVFVTKMINKDGEAFYVTVKAPEDDEIKANECPLNIEFDKANANLTHTKDTIETDDGVREYVHHTLWLKKYTRSAEKYVDTSLDDFE